MDLKIDKKITLIKKRLNQSLPGWDSQKKMAVMPISPVTRLAFIPPANAKLAAVAIILFQEDNKLKFFLTRRTSNVDHHKGQISLPGGAKDEGESFEDASVKPLFKPIILSLISKFCTVVVTPVTFKLPSMLTSPVKADPDNAALSFTRVLK